jgi:hypothetical protein
MVLADGLELKVFHIFLLLWSFLSQSTQLQQLTVKDDDLVTMNSWPETFEFSASS